MLKFEQIGVALQQESTSKREAIQKLQYSCRVCCYRGIHLTCEQCAIQATHAITISYFDSVQEAAKGQRCSCQQ